MEDCDVLKGENDEGKRGEKVKEGEEKKKSDGQAFVSTTRDFFYGNFYETE